MYFAPSAKTVSCKSHADNLYFKIEKKKEILIQSIPRLIIIILR